MLLDSAHEVISDWQTLSSWRYGIAALRRVDSSLNRRVTGRLFLAGWVGIIDVNKYTPLFMPPSFLPCLLPAKKRRAALVYTTSTSSPLPKGQPLGWMTFP